MPPQAALELYVTVVKNPSMIIERTMITLQNEQFPEIHELFINVDTFSTEWLSTSYEISPTISVK